jgi:hypothetical protein
VFYFYFFPGDFDWDRGRILESIRRSAKAPAAGGPSDASELFLNLGKLARLSGWNAAPAEALRLARESGMGLEAASALEARTLESELHEFLGTIRRRAPSVDTKQVAWTPSERRVAWTPTKRDLIDQTVHRSANARWAASILLHRDRLELIGQAIDHFGPHDAAVLWMQPTRLSLA